MSTSFWKRPAKLIYVSRDAQGLATAFSCVWDARPHEIESGHWISDVEHLLFAGTNDHMQKFFGSELKPGECKAFSITEVTVQ